MDRRHKQVKVLRAWEFKYHPFLSYETIILSLGVLDRKNNLSEIRRSKEVERSDSERQRGGHPADWLSYGRRMNERLGLAAHITI